MLPIVFGLLTASKLNIRSMDQVASILSYIFPFNVASPCYYVKICIHFCHINGHTCSGRLYICMYDDELCYAQVIIKLCYVIH